MTISPTYGFTTNLLANYEAQNFRLTIEYRFLPSDQPRRVILSCDTRQVDYSQSLPFAYEIIDIPSMYQYRLALSGETLRTFDFEIYPLLRLVAGPGVHIRFENFRPDSRPNLRTPGVEIFRAQEPGAVPLQSTGINPSYFAGLAFLPEDFWEIFLRKPKRSFACGDFPRIDIESPINVTPRPMRVGEALKTVFMNKDQSFYLDTRCQPPLVEMLPNGIRIIDVTTDSHVMVTVPTAGRDSGNARFSYWIEYDGDNPTIVHLTKTKSVQVQYITLFRKSIADGDTFPLDHFPFSAPRPASDIAKAVALKFELRVDEVYGIFDVPVQGTDRYIDNRRAVAPEVPLTEEELRRVRSLFETVIDVGIGFIPIVGDLVDVAEFVAGYDKWGHKLSTLERVVTGVGVLLPFVSGRMMRVALKAL